MRKRRRVTAAATAARPTTDELLPIPCASTSQRVVLDGVEYTRRCLEREGHRALDVPHKWSGWTPTGNTVTEDASVELDF